MGAKNLNCIVTVWGHPAPRGCRFLSSEWAVGQREAELARVQVLGQACHR